jgi:radical SAM superfamily enzyme YgiQ (UPF0313 family)
MGRMPHVSLVSLSGFRIREAEMASLGMSLPGLKARAGAIAAMPALGLLTLASLCPDCWTCDYHESPAPDDALLERICERRPNLVAISALTASIQEAYRFSDRLRQRGIRVALGGLHVTACPDEAKIHSDAIVIGDGEPVWAQILDDVEAGSLRPVYRPAQPFDLDRSPVPRFDLLGIRPRARYTIQTQRGCPFACEFCGASRLLGPFRVKPVANLRRELAAITAIDPKPMIELADDNTFAGNRPFEGLVDLLAESGARYFAEVDWLVGERPDLVRRLADSGCVQVLIGVESLIFRHPGMGAKLAALPRVIDAVEAIQSAGVAVIGCFIVGADGETRQSIDRLTKFLATTPFADVQLTIQTPFPGTALHRRLQRTGRLLADRGWDHYTLFDVAFQPDAMSVDELERGFRDAVQQAFGPSEAARRAAIRRRIWRSRGS